MATTPSSPRAASDFFNSLLGMFRRHRLALGCAAMMLAPGAVWAAGPIKIGFPIPLSGPTATYGVPILKGRSPRSTPRAGCSAASS